MSVRILRPPPTLLSTTTTPLLNPRHHNQTRTFLSSFTPPQVLTAHRTLPYPSLAIYNIIADIPSYPSFLPFCASADITAWSKPDAHYKRKWPQQAFLTVGYGDRIAESFTSRVLCLPPVSEKGRAGVGYVEAVSGKGEFESGAKREGVEHHDHAVDGGVDASGEGPMDMLRTKWMVKSFPYKHAPGAAGSAEQGNEKPASGDGEMTDVTLSIEYRFNNMAYDMMSRAVAPKLADKMIEAFEKRVKSLLDK